MSHDDLFFLVSVVAFIVFVAVNMVHESEQKCWKQLSSELQVSTIKFCSKLYPRCDSPEVNLFCGKFKGEEIHGEFAVECDFDFGDWTNPVETSKNWIKVGGKCEEGDVATLFVKKYWPVLKNKKEQINQEKFQEGLRKMGIERQERLLREAGEERERQDRLAAEAAKERERWANAEEKLNKIVL